MASIGDAILAINSDARVKVTEENIDTIEWRVGTPIPKADILAKLAELEVAEDAAVTQKEADEAQLATDKASAKAKLIAGEALTEAEADTIVI
jgi:hypothetical protein